MPTDKDSRKHRESRTLGNEKHSQGRRKATKAVTNFESCASCFSEQPGNGPRVKDQGRLRHVRVWGI